MHVDYKTSYAIFVTGLIIGTPLIVVFGSLSDRFGRKLVMITGLLLGCLTLMPAFHALANFTNPALLEFSERYPITTSTEGCTFSLFAKPLSECDKARNLFSREGLSYTSVPAPKGGGFVTTIGETRLSGFDEVAYRKTLEGLGFDGAARDVNYVGAIGIVVWMLALVGMVYGPMAAFLVEMFPARVRSTSLSVPYHLGVGILGGFLPFAASALVVYYGNIFAGLWYPIAIASAAAIVALVFLPETRGRAID
jgi:MFS family permease